MRVVIGTPGLGHVSAVRVWWSGASCTVHADATTLDLLTAEELAEAHRVVEANTVEVDSIEGPVRRVPILVPRVG